MRTALYRIVQEAVNNAVRHSAAREIQIKIRASRKKIHVSIADDGCGARPRRVSSGGISHMHTRAALIGARVRVQPGPEGQGTSVLITVPRAETPEALRSVKSAIA